MLDMACNLTNICPSETDCIARHRELNSSNLLSNKVSQQNQQNCSHYKQKFPDQDRPISSPVSNLITLESPAKFCSTLSFSTQQRVLQRNTKQLENVSVSNASHNANPYNSAYNNQYSNQYNSQVAPGVSNQAVTISDYQPAPETAVEPSFDKIQNCQTFYNWLEPPAVITQNRRLPVITGSLQQRDDMYVAQTYVQQDYAPNDKQQSQTVTNSQKSPVVDLLQNSIYPQPHVAQQNCALNDKQQGQTMIHHRKSPVAGQSPSNIYLHPHMVQQNYKFNNRQQGQTVVNSQKSPVADLLQNNIYPQPHAAQQNCALNDKQQGQTMIHHRKSPVAGQSPSNIYLHPHMAQQNYEFNNRQQGQTVVNPQKSPVADLLPNNIYPQPYMMQQGYAGNNGEKQNQIAASNQESSVTKPSQMILQENNDTQATQQYMMNYAANNGEQQSHVAANNCEMDQQQSSDGTTTNGKFKSYEWMIPKRGSGNENKRTRKTYSPQATFRLETVFYATPYLSKAERHKLSIELDLTEKQIKIWFQNRRMKAKKEQQQRLSINQQQQQELPIKQQSGKCSKTCVQEQLAPQQELIILQQHLAMQQTQQPTMQQQWPTAQQPQLYQTHQGYQN